MAEKLKLINREMWDPKTSIGKMVKSGEISAIEQVFDMGKPILEPEVVDVLLPDLETETLQVKTTQRVTDSGKRTQFRVVVVIGDRKGHVGLGVGKSDEMKPAMEYAVRNAKKNVISIKSGCGSWECRCQVQHSLPQRTTGKMGSTTVTLKPAPRGLGVAANDVVKKVLSIAGVKDVWSSAQGGSNLYNMSVATINALENLNKQKTPAS
ncbi:MAG: 30S ribosomal protein S5 [Candidatus Micrarchaeota archaeon]|nr:30S ribosomal protein S5 [Candidatus Micrarchaeota archaeon]